MTRQLTAAEWRLIASCLELAREQGWSDGRLVPLRDLAWEKVVELGERP